MQLKTFIAKDQKGCKNVDLAVIRDLWTVRFGMMLFILLYKIMAIH